MELTPELYKAFRTAIRSGSVSQVEELIAADPARLSIMTPFGTWLHVAASAGQLEIVKKLVELGADINALGGTDGHSGTAIDDAVSDGHCSIVEYLIESGAILNFSDPASNPLFSAIYNDHATIARLLLASGIDPLVVYRGQNGKLKTALTFAMEYGRTAIVEILKQAGCRLPVEGVDIPVGETPSDALPAVPTSAKSESSRDKLIAYMADRFSPVDSLALQEIVPVDGDVHISIHVIQPTETHPFLTLFTTGMSDQPMTVPAGQDDYRFAELVIHLPSEWPHPKGSPKKKAVQWPVEWLRKIAYYPHLNGTWLGGATTIIASDDPPAPLGPNTKLSCLLLLADYPNLIPITLDDGKIVHLYTVVPLYTEERDYELKHGIVALIDRLQMLGIFTVVGLKRPNVVTD